jgi:polar amino acid transport system permease protein
MLVHTLLSKVPDYAGKPQWRFSWDVVGKYLFDPIVMKGVVLTLEITGLAMAIGITLGIITAVIRLSPVRVFAGVAWLYTWFFRGTPVYIRLIFLFNIAAIYPHLELGVPFGPSFWHIDLVTFMTPVVAAVTALIAE